MIVRINPQGTPWHEADLAAVRDRGVAAVILPKAEDVETVGNVVRALDGVPIITLIETAKGLANARSIATVEGVMRLAFGSVDFCADLGIAHERDILLPARSELVLASRLASIAATIDGVTVRLESSGVALEDAQHARAVGMTGKLCIHPKQIKELSIACLKSAPIATLAPSEHVSGLSWSFA